MSKQKLTYEQLLRLANKDVAYTAYRTKDEKFMSTMPKELREILNQLKQKAAAFGSCNSVFKWEHDALLESYIDQLD